MQNSAEIVDTTRLWASRVSKRSKISETNSVSVDDGPTCMSSSSLVTFGPRTPEKFGAVDPIKMDDDENVVA